MTDEEYEDRKRRLEGDLEDAKKALRNAQTRIAEITIGLQGLTRVHREQRPES